MDKTDKYKTNKYSIDKLKTNKYRIGKYSHLTNLKKIVSITIYIVHH